MPREPVLALALPGPVTHPRHVCVSSSVERVETDTLLIDSVNVKHLE